jgi:hypothetical protein
MPSFFAISVAPTGDNQTTGQAVIAAGVLYPVFGLLLSPMIAAAAMALSSVSVITNALRIRRLKLDESSRETGNWFRVLFLVHRILEAELPRLDAGDTQG